MNQEDLERKLHSLIPRVVSYGEYQSTGYGAHCLMFSLANMDFYFSYSTVVAFRAPGAGLVVIRNYWGPTTGKHLKWIDGCTTKTGKHRLEDADFYKLLYNVMVEQGMIEGETITEMTQMLDDLVAGVQAKAPDKRAGLPMIEETDHLRLDPREMV